MIKMDSFKLEKPRFNYTTNGRGGIVRIRQEAYNTLVEMANITGRSLSEIASRAILYAAEHVEYVEYEIQNEESI